MGKFRGDRGGGGKKDKKSAYKKAFSDSKRAEELQGDGLSGFLITCDMKNEKKCVKEVTYMLSDYVEKLYPGLDVATIIEEAREAKKLEQD